jgi:CDP-diacylglycerol--glycerol-3-phosphate 3-phosphatidyltransferase
MITISNGLSFIRAPLAFLFWQDDPKVRFTAILLAMITDCVDGYLARRNKSASQFGAILDPAMDKFFVYFALTMLFIEAKIGPYALATMLSRDIFLSFYGLAMLITGRWKTIVFRALRWGKITTALQFFVLMGLTFGIDFPWYIYVSFIAMGWFAFLELVPFFRMRAVPHR